MSKQEASACIASATGVGPVLRFFALTAAFGTTAPDWSVTVPPMAPSVVDCAKRPQASSSIAIHARQQRPTEAPTSFVLIEIPPLDLPTLRAIVRGPQALRGWRGGLLTLGTNHLSRERLLQTATSTLFYDHTFYHKMQVN